MDVQARGPRFHGARLDPYVPDLERTSNNSAADSRKIIVSRSSRQWRRDMRFRKSFFGET